MINVWVWDISKWRSSSDITSASLSLFRDWCIGQGAKLMILDPLLLQAQAKAEKEKAAKEEAALSAARAAAAADAAAASTAQVLPKKKPGAQKAMLKGARMAFSNNPAAAQPSKITFSKVYTSYICYTATRV